MLKYQGYLVLLCILCSTLWWNSLWKYPMEYFLFNLANENQMMRKLLNFYLIFLAVHLTLQFLLGDASLNLMFNGIWELSRAPFIEKFSFAANFSSTNTWKWNFCYNESFISTSGCTCHRNFSLISCLIIVVVECSEWVKEAHLMANIC